MATRSRLGRDPLENAPKPKAAAAGPKSAKKSATAKSPASQAGAKKTPQAGKARAGGSQAPTPQRPELVEAAIPAAPPLSETTDPVVAKPAAPPASEGALAAASLGATPSPEPMPPVVTTQPAATAVEQTEPLSASAQGQAEASRTETAPAEPDLAATGVPEPCPAQPPAQAASAGPADSAPGAAATTIAPPQSEPTTPPSPAATCEAAGHTAPDEHALALFFRGVLDAFLPDDPAALRVLIDAGAATLPVEKALFFSHALQRIVFPTVRPDQFTRRPGEDCGPVPVLTVRLSATAGDRHALQLSDNGHFFRQRWPQPRLDLEALRPLMTHVLANHGSVQLAQGRCVAFTVTG